MKSSYELAMERLSQSAPVKKLSGGQIKKIQEIENRFKAKIAERETIMRGKIEAAKIDHNDGESETLQRELAIELRRLEEECEEKKEEIRKGH